MVIYIFLNWIISSEKECEDDHSNIMDCVTTFLPLGGLRRQQAARVAVLDDLHIISYLLNSVLIVMRCLGKGESNVHCSFT